MGGINSVAMVSSSSPLARNFNGNHSRPKLAWEYSSQIECEKDHRNMETNMTKPYCNSVWDSFLCWPSAFPGTLSSQRCPPNKGVDPSKFAYKKCSSDGRWEGKNLGDYSRPQGWTNYSSCFIPEIKDLLDRLHNRAEEAQIKIQVAQGIRIMEVTGLSLSFFTLVLSLFIFAYFRGLRNKRIRIHRNLFVAMLIQVIIRLILYTDQAIVRNDFTGLIGARIAHDTPGIDNTPILCELFYILLEYARTSMFMWMFIEGLYLHNMVAVAFFQGSKTFVFYSVIGWGSPIIFTVLWATVTATYYKSIQCWWGYSLSIYFWILEGPRMFVIVINFLFLLNIIRILITKLRTSNSSEAQQVGKSVKAAVILLPLLGITNMMNIVPSPLERSALEFGLWSYTTNFLSAFQGFFISLIHCFLNREVRSSILKRWDDHSNIRNITYNNQRIQKKFEKNLSPANAVIPVDMTRNQQKPLPRPAFEEQCVITSL